MSTPSTRTNQPLCATVSNVSKKYCRKLHRSLRYGLVDLARESIGLPTSNQLRRDEFYALKNVSFEMRRGDCIGLLGPNGAGKTTLMKILNGLLKPSEGVVRMRGKVAALTQLGAGFNPVLSGEENVFINAAVLGFSRRETIQMLDDIVDFAEIGDAIDAPVKTYSAGMRSRLGFAIAALVRPDVLLMDEVLATGDRGFRLKCFNHLEELKANGTSILIVSHAVGPLTRICNRAVVLENGELRVDGAIDEGIECYEELVHVSRYGDASNCDDDEIPESPTSVATTPNRKIWINSIQLINHEGEVIDGAESGDSVRIRIEIQSRESNSKPRLIIVFTNESGVLTTTVSPVNFIDSNDTATFLDLCIPDLNLLHGAYFLEARIVGESPDDIYSTRTFVLKVNSARKQGVIALSHKWEKAAGVAPTIESDSATARL